MKKIGAVTKIAGKVLLALLLLSCVVIVFIDRVHGNWVPVLAVLALIIAFKFVTRPRTPATQLQAGIAERARIKRFNDVMFVVLLVLFGLLLVLILVMKFAS